MTDDDSDSNSNTLAAGMDALATGLDGESKRVRIRSILDETAGDHILFESDDGEETISLYRYWGGTCDADARVARVSYIHETPGDDPPLLGSDVYSFPMDRIDPLPDPSESDPDDSDSDIEGTDGP